MKGEMRKDQILDCSKQLFSQKGYYETHVEDVIREARVGKGTFYRYFKNKEDLFISLLLKFLKEWEAVAFIDPNEFQVNNVHDQFKLLTRRSFQFFQQNDDLCNIYLRIGPGLNEIFEPYMVRFEQQMLDYIRRYLEKGKHIGIVRPGIDVDLAANIIAGAFLRVDYYYFVVKKTVNGGDIIERLAGEFLSIIMHGIMA